MGPFETELRANFLGIRLFDLSRTVDEALKLQSQIECLIRTLLRSAGITEFRMLSPRRDLRIAQVESLSLEGKPLAEMTDEEIIERLQYFRFGQLMEAASRQSEQRQERELAPLLGSFSQAFCDVAQAPGNPAGPPFPLEAGRR